jgi:IS4 transposase
LQAKSPLGEILIETINTDTHQEEQKKFSLKTLEDIMVPAIWRGTGHPQNKLAPIKINVVEAYDNEIKWLLLTNLPAKTMCDATFVVESYKKRWHIESFHKVLKTAYKADQVYLHHSREAICNLLTMINIAACQTY